MQHFDAIVVGAGSGLDIASALAERGKRVAIVEKGPMGGTCLNRGCIPSKMIIHSADVMDTVLRAGEFGIHLKGRPRVDFASITRHASRVVDKDARDIEKGIRANPRLTLFKGQGRFIGRKKMKIGKHLISGQQMFILAGTRPTAPPIDGLEGSGYLTSKEALRVTKQPKSLIVLGGGYIAAELAHFYGALGTKVTIVQRSGLLLKREDHEVAKLFTKEFSKRHRVLLNHQVKRVEKKQGTFIVHAGKKRLQADQLLVALGRKPNTDLLDTKAGGIATDKRGYIKTNDYLETSVPGVWAAGDIAGKYFFKHSANLEAQYALHNALNPKEKTRVDYTGMPHAVFTNPQLAGVGETQEQLDLRRAAYLVGRYDYKNTGMGEALKERSGFVKMLVDPESRLILGCHIIGPDAATLIHEVILAIKVGATVDALMNTIHIHPALSEVVQRATWNLS